MNKYIIFDMDGVLVDLYNYPNWLSLLRSGNTKPYKKATPLVEMDVLRTILQELKKQGWVIGVTSWGSLDSDKDFLKRTKTVKKEWLKDYNFPYDFINVVPYGIEKSLITKNLSGYQILIDDNKKNRENWSNGKAVFPTDLIDYLLQLLAKEF